MSLLAAAIDHLSNVGCRVICTTHFLELFSLDILASGRGGVECYKMVTHIPSEEEEGDAVPLFQLERGVALSSDGLLCAKMAGVDPTVLARGAEILDAIQKGRAIKSVRAAAPIDGREMLKLFLSRTDWENSKPEEVQELMGRVREYKDEQSR
mmetsp:Transcript_10028/g.19959  ORF Transcript_10028/g.19959 Transcript_10028/m.19959 type:complete len:153 (+) Transcript_10028:134-592(+)